MRTLLVTALALALASSAAAPGFARGAGPHLGSVAPVTHALSEALRDKGRAEVQLERIVMDPIDGRSEAVRGRLTLELPDRALIEFPESGERIALRRNGGEWIQPALRQMVRFGAEDAAGVARWWRLLLDPGAVAAWAQPLGPHRYLVIVAGGGEDAPDTARVMLDAAGLPLRLEIQDAPGSHSMYRFHEWRFKHPLGPEAFVIHAPLDYQVVPLH